MILPIVPKNIPAFRALLIPWPLHRTCCVAGDGGSVYSVVVAVVMVVVVLIIVVGVHVTVTGDSV